MAAAFKINTFDSFVEQFTKVLFLLSNNNI